MPSAFLLPPLAKKKKLAGMSRTENGMKETPSGLVSSGPNGPQRVAKRAIPTLLRLAKR